MVQRQINGRFATGNAGGPGRPPRAVEADYLAALSAGVPLEAWQAIVARAVKDATAGCRHAREWLARYLLPQKPAAGIDGRDVAVQVIQDPDWYGNAAELRKAMLEEPDYLDYLRWRAMVQDQSDAPANGRASP